MKDEDTVVWTVPAFGTFHKKYVQYINKLLKKDGYDIKLAVRAVDATKTPDTYNNTLKSVLKSGETDIVNTGISTDDNLIALPLIEHRKGYFPSDYVTSEDTCDSIASAMVSGNYAIIAGNSQSYIEDYKNQLTIVNIKNCKYCLTDDASTAVAANSTKKDKAEQLLYLLYTNKKYANALAYGEEGKDYSVDDDGYYTCSSQTVNMVPDGSYGLYDNIYQEKGNEFAPNLLKNKRQYLLSDLCQKSVFLGFHPDVSEILSDISGLRYDIADAENEICCADDFDTAYDAAATKINKEAKSIEEVLQTQYGKWYKTYGK